MSVKAWRLWLVDEEGALYSLFQPTKWPVVLRAQRAPRELEEYRVIQQTYSQAEIETYRAVGYDHTTHNLRAVSCERDKAHFCVCSSCSRDIARRLNWPSPLKEGDVISFWDNVGIYALREPFYSFSFFELLGKDVSGFVELFGHIVEHENGYRAEAALVCGPLQLNVDDPKLAKKIADKYECEVTVAQEVKQGSVFGDWP